MRPGFEPRYSRVGFSEKRLRPVHRHYFRAGPRAARSSQKNNFRAILEFANVHSPRNSRKFKHRDYYKYRHNALETAPQEVQYINSSTFQVPYYMQPMYG